MHGLLGELFAVGGDLRVVGPDPAHAFFHCFQQGKVVFVVRQITAVVDLSAQAFGDGGQRQFGLLGIVAIAGDHAVEPADLPPAKSLTMK